MGISIAITFILLGFIFLALRRVFGVFPDSWEWVGIVLAGVGLTMGTPFVFQKLWGQPDLRTRFENGVEGADRFLPVYLENPPIKKRILRWLGVKRDTIQSLTIQFRIREVGSGRILIPIRQARIYSDDDPTDFGRNRISLPPTYSVAATIIVAQWDTETGKALIPPDRIREGFSLDVGQYQVDIILSVDGEPKIISRQFVVGQKADDLSWIKQN